MLTIKRVVIFVIALCTISLHAMKRQRTEIVEENSSCKKLVLEEKPHFDTFLFLIQQPILALVIIDKSKTCILAASALESLSRTCKAFNEHFNNRPVMLNLVKQISTHFNQSNQYVARVLSIKTANKIHDTQELLYAYMHGAQENSQYVIQPLNHLETTMGIDVNYTYGQDKTTPLAIILKESHQSQVKGKIIDWLLKRDATIAPVTKHRDSAASIALDHNDFELLGKFLFHKDFNPNYVGKNGNTLLHNCLIVLLTKGKCSTCQKLCRSSEIIAIINYLLCKKIDLSITNHAGKTPLMLAKKLDYDPINIFFELAKAQTTLTST
jgi:ankyrin repeat protein